MNFGETCPTCGESTGLLGHHICKFTRLHDEPFSTQYESPVADATPGQIADLFGNPYRCGVCFNRMTLDGVHYCTGRK
jgi:hypothetical protein